MLKAPSVACGALNWRLLDARIDLTLASAAGEAPPLLVQQHPGHFFTVERFLRHAIFHRRLEGVHRRGRNTEEKWLRIPSAPVPVAHTLTEVRFIDTCVSAKGKRPRAPLCDVKPPPLQEDKASEYRQPF